MEWLLMTVIFISSVFISMTKPQIIQQIPHLAPTVKPTNDLNFRLSPTPFIKDDLRLIYPGSSQISPNTFTSLDSPDTVTNWYKTQIEKLNLNINTFIKTSSNGNIINRLSASGRTQNIDIEITKQSSSSITNIRYLSV